MNRFRFLGPTPDRVRSRGFRVRLNHRPDDVSLRRDSFTMDNRTASGSGSGSTRFEGNNAAATVACGRLGLTDIARASLRVGLEFPDLSFTGDVIFIVDRVEDCEVT